MGRGRVVSYDEPVRCGDVLVKSGELIFADFDGIVVIPSEVESQVVRLAKERVGKESLTRAELMAGATLRDVFNKYRVL